MDGMYEVYFHGSAPPGGNPMSVGVVLTEDGDEIDQVSGVISYPGNGERAQWEALLQAMALAAKHGVRRVVFKGDSRTVINYMNGTTIGRGFESMDYYKLARKDQLNFDQSFFQWVDGSKNRSAIALSRAAIEL